MTGKVRQVPRGPDGKPVTALVTNTGTVIADGGTVTLTAAAADGIVQDLVSAGGRIQANAAGGRPGSVVIAGTGGSVTVAGRVSADGTAPGESGGAVVVNATGTVTVATGARISASGMAGGGTVAVGTTLARTSGGAGVTGQPTATSTVVQRGARIAANARRRGNGGRVTVLSTGQTSVAGKVAARGGRQSGDGGAVEVSGGTLGLTGTITTAAPKGSAGTILLDPTDLTIAVSGRNIAPGAGDPSIAASDLPADAVVTPAALGSLQGTVHLQASDTITVAASVTFTSAQSSLWLDAQNCIVVNGGTTITLPGGGGTPGEIRLTSGVGGTALLGSLNTGTIEFETPGAVTQGPASAVTAANIWGNAGSIALTSRLNQVSGVGQGNATVGGGRFVVTAGDFSLTTASTNLGVGDNFQGNGISVPSGHTIALVTDGITAATAGSTTPPLDAANGTVSIAPFTAGRPVELVYQAKTPGALSLSTQDLYGIGASTLVLGSASAGPLTVGADGGYIYNTPNTLSLQSGASISQAGDFSVGTLIASAPTINLPSANNSIGALGGAAASGDITVTSGEPMQVTGPVSGANVSLTTFGDLGLAADVAASGTLTLVTNQYVVAGAPPPNGSGGGPQTLGNLGAITQSASAVTAGTLVATTASDIALTSTTNAINRVGNVASSGNLTLNNGPRPLTVGGTLSAGPSSVLSVSTGGNLALAATSVLSSDTQVALAAGGAITQAQGSSIATPALSGNAASAALTSTTNQVGSVVFFNAASGGFALTDGIALTVGPNDGLTSIAVPSGQLIALVADQIALAAPLTAPGGTVALAPLTAGRPIELIASGNQNPAALSLQQSDLGQITAGTLQLGSVSAGPITLGNPGYAIALANVGTLDLLSVGAITEPGALVVGTLAGTAQSASLDGNNLIGTLAGFTTQGGFSLRDGQPLRVTGPVAGGGSVALDVTGGLALAGSLSTPGTATLNVTGSVMQPGGSVAAGTLAGSAASFALTQPGNAIAAAGVLTSAGDLALTDGRALTVAGAVTAGSSGTLTLDVAGDLAIPGALSGPGSVVLNATGAITGPGGVSAGTLSGSAASVSLGGFGTAIGTLGAFTTAGGIALTNYSPLSVSGPVTAGTGIALTAPGTLTISGNLFAPTVALTATAGRFGAGDIVQSGGSLATGLLSGSASGAVSLAGPFNQVVTLGDFRSSGGFTLTDARSLAVTGTVTDPPGIALNVTGDLVLSGVLSAPSASLTASGAITETGAGAVAVGTLAGKAASASLTGPNSIGTLGSFSTSGAFTLSDSRGLQMWGPVTAAGGVGLTVAGDLTIPGSVSTPGTLTLAASGTLAEIGAGHVAAGTLTGSAARLASFGAGPAAANVATLGSFAVTNGSFDLTDEQALTINGPLSAATLSIAAPGRVTLAGGTITTGSPSSPTAPSSVIQVFGGPGGTAMLVQTGTTQVLPLGGGTATLRLSLPGNGGTLSLNDLEAGGADIVLATGTGGTATGTLHANNLLVVGQGGSASLSGTVQGQGGFPAAEISRIGQFDVRYQLNGCPIEAASCLPLTPTPTPTQTPAPTSTPTPVNLLQQDVDGSLILPTKSRLRPELLALDPFPLTLGVVQDLDDPDFLLPNVSDRDY